MNILKVLAVSGLAPHGNGDARRMVCQGAVKVNGEIVLDPHFEVKEGKQNIQVGRRKKVINVGDLNG